MFARMFPLLPPLNVSDSKLQALAESMLDAAFANAGQFHHGPLRFVDDLNPLGD